MSNTAIEVSPALPSMYRQLVDARNAAFQQNAEVIKCASVLGTELSRHTEQGELELVVASVDGMSMQQARACIKVSEFVREKKGELDNAGWRQMLMLTELVPSPEPRNPEPGKPIKILLWMSRIRARIPRLSVQEKHVLRGELQRLIDAL
jgi:hypothetical protein